jgi:hypothetical protein
MDYPQPVLRASTLAGIFILALALRLTYVLVTHTGEIGAIADQGGGIALNMLEGNGYVYSFGICSNFRSFRMPVLPLTLYAIWSTFGYNLLVPKLVFAGISSATCVLMALLATRLFDVRSGFFAGVLGALFPNSIHWSSMLGNETLTAFFAVLGIYFLCDPRSVRKCVLAGGSLALLALTRPFFLPFPLLCGLVLLASPENWAQGMKRALCFGMVVGAMFLPWVVRNWQVHGKLQITSTEGGMSVLECNNPVAFARGGEWIQGYAESLPEVTALAPSLSEVELNQLLYKKTADFILAEPGEYAHAMLLRVIHFWSPSPMYGYSTRYTVVMLLTCAPAFALALAGAIFSSRRCRTTHLLIISLIAWVTLASALTNAQIRYRAPIEPFVLLYAGAGLAMLLALARGVLAPARLQSGVEGALGDLSRVPPSDNAPIR